MDEASSTERLEEETAPTQPRPWGARGGDIAAGLLDGASGTTFPASMRVPSSPWQDTGWRQRKRKGRDTKEQCVRLTTKILSKAFNPSAQWHHCSSQERTGWKALLHSAARQLSLSPQPPSEPTADLGFGSRPLNLGKFFLLQGSCYSCQCYYFYGIR